mmetsp:Transcript_9428/g.26659  ORF Transcript_9428/g.26659 Transcript_9428/m.26659 type:complete len:545 (+) Transcript_9428:69-1703(+)
MNMKLLVAPPYGALQVRAAPVAVALVLVLLLLASCLPPPPPSHLVRHWWCPSSSPTPPTIGVISFAVTLGLGRELFFCPHELALYGTWLGLKFQLWLTIPGVLAIGEEAAKVQNTEFIQLVDDLIRDSHLEELVRGPRHHGDGSHVRNVGFHSRSGARVEDGALLGRPLEAQSGAEVGLGGTPVAVVGANKGEGTCGVLLHAEEGLLHEVWSRGVLGSRGGGRAVPPGRLGRRGGHFWGLFPAAEELRDVLLPHHPFHLNLGAAVDCGSGSWLMQLGQRVKHACPTASIRSFRDAAGDALQSELVQEAGGAQHRRRCDARKHGDDGDGDPGSLEGAEKWRKGLPDPDLLEGVQKHRVLLLFGVVRCRPATDGPVSSGPPRRVLVQEPGGPGELPMLHLRKYVGVLLGVRSPCGPAQGIDGHVRWGHAACSGDLGQGRRGLARLGRHHAPEESLERAQVQHDAIELEDGPKALVRIPHLSHAAQVVWSEQLCQLIHGQIALPLEVLNSLLLPLVLDLAATGTCSVGVGLIVRSHVIHRPGEAVER